MKQYYFYKKTGIPHNNPQKSPLSIPHQNIVTKTDTKNNDRA